MSEHLVRRMVPVTVWRLGIDGVDVSVVVEQLQVVAESGMGLRFEPLGARFADRGVEVILGSLGGGVFLGDMEQRGGVETVAIRRLESRAEFLLLALGRHQGHTGGVGVGVRAERSGIAGVGRQAVVEQVQRVDPSGEFPSVTVGLAAGAAVLAGDADPVLVQTK